MADLLQLLPLDQAGLDRFADDPPDVRRRARLVAAFGLLAIGGGMTLAATHYFFFQISAWLVTPPLLAGLVAIVAQPLLLRRRQLRLGGHVIAACWLLACGWGAWLRGGLASPPMMTQVAVPFIALVLIDRRAAGLWGIVVCAEYLFYGVLAALGVTLPDRMAPAHWVTSNVVTSSLFGVLVLAMAFALEWMRIKAQEELAEAQGKKLEAERETQLLRADRLASVGQLAASMAHEINNPLSYVLSNLEFLSAAVPGAELREALRDAIEGAERVRTIVQDLKTFARADDEQLLPVDFKKVVTSSLRMVAGEVKHRAVLRTEFSECPLVLASETRLGQIVVNLVVNAAQAIPEKGHGGYEIVVSVAATPEGAARLVVRDNAAGIPPEILHRVTEPFFTTKPIGIGTGLGLSVCTNLVKRFGGTMEIASTLGAGTTITVTLPAALDEEEPVADSGPTSAWTGSPLRILVIDDDLGILRLMGRLLRSHDVTIAGGGREGLSILEADHGFDLVLCDVMMPEVTGVDVARALTERNPDLAGKLVFITGGAITERTQAFLGSTVHPILTKPVEAAAVARLLDEAGRRRDGPRA